MDGVYAPTQGLVLRIPTTVHKSIHANVKRDTVVKLAKKSFAQGRVEANTVVNLESVTTKQVSANVEKNITVWSVSFCGARAGEVQGVGAADMVGVMAKEHAVAIMVGSLEFERTVTGKVANSHAAAMALVLMERAFALMGLAVRDAILPSARVKRKNAMVEEHVILPMEHALVSKVLQVQRVN